MARVDRGDVRLRLASTVVLAPLALGAVWLGGWYFAVLVLAAASGMGWEWARLTGCRGLRLRGLGVAAAALPVLALALGWPAAGLVLALAGAGVVWVAVRAQAGPAPLWAALGTGWIAVACLACLWLGADHVVGRGGLLWLFVTVWASDTGAFITGRAIGGPRLSPRLSPGKTWAGAVGGLVAAALVGWCAALWAGAGVTLLVPAGIALGLAAQAGDLAESLAKRRFGVKDSGGLIPGHGGLLDRLDGMLAAAALLSLMTLAAGASPLAWQV